MTLLLAAALLAGALGVAKLQVLSTRTLGPEQAIPDTPLTVRLPPRWTMDRRDRSRFVLQVQRDAPGGLVWEVDPWIRFGFERGATFIPARQWLAAQSINPTRVEPARIGELPAIQARKVLRRQWGRVAIARELILRVAILPSGDVVHVEYLPMTDLTPADFALFDQVCAAVRVVDPALIAAPQAAMQRAGVDLPVQSGATFGSSTLPEVAALTIGGSVAGEPAWSLGVFRTWLAVGRTPRDLLLDLAANVWPLADELPPVKEQARPDGARVATVARPGSARRADRVAAAWLVAQSPEQAALLILYTDDAYLVPATQVAQQIAEQIMIRPLETLAALEDAGAAGIALATLLNQKGALPWWGSQPTQRAYRGDTPRGEENILIQRRAIQRDPARGYEGVMRRSNRRADFEEGAEWTLDGRAIGYTYRSELVLGEGLALAVRERRSGTGDLVHRARLINAVEQWSGTFRPGPGFVAPPVEPIAEARAARQAETALLIEVATPLGRGTNTRLLRPLSPEDGCARVLVLDDYHPVGAILSFDEDGELVEQVEPNARYQRVR